MVILKFNYENKIDQILFEGNLVDSVRKYEELTEEFEKDGNFMVNELNIGGKSSTTLVREFADFERGHVFDLIICGFVAKMVTVEGT